MIYCIWYPAGGFGHYINAVLSLYGKNFQRPVSDKFLFDSLGTSHALPLSAPKYVHNQPDYKFDFVKDKNYSVLIDNGNLDESQNFKKFFQDFSVIKVCYSDHTWPIFAKTTIVKTGQPKFEQEVNVNNEWNSNDNWAIREKYFLYLRDHALRHMWKPSADCKNLLIDDLLAYEKFKNKLNEFGIEVDDFESLWSNWYNNNQEYIQPLTWAQQTLTAIKNFKDVDISNVDCLWSQAILYYLIWIEYQFEVPHNDCSNWFTSTNDVAKMLVKHGVNIDTN